MHQRLVALRDRAPALLPACTLAAVFVAMLWLSWGTWPDVLVDFGHELYAAWQLSEGKALGVDLAWIATGPLSPYLNAALFAVFGPSLRVLVVFNLAILAGITALLYALVRELSDRPTATLATVAFLLVFAFGQYVGIGNYNYVTPYSHGITHGMLLSLASIWLFRRYAASGGPWRAALAGAGVGLVFLTKPEVFAACAAAVGVLWAARTAERRSAREAVRDLLLLAIPAAAVLALATLLLASQMQLATAWRVALTPWLLLATPFTTLPFYRSGMGIDRPVENLAALLGVAGWWALAFGAAALLDVAMRRVRPSRPVVITVALLVGFVPLTLLLAPFGWYPIARPFPLLVLAGGVGYGWRVLARPPGADRSRAVLGLAMCAFAGGLLGKMLLKARIEHYGFALAMPAAMLVIVWATSSAPGALARWRGGGRFFRGVAVGIVLAAAVGFVRISHAWSSRKSVAVGVEPDRFLADQRGAYVVAMMQLIERLAAPGDTLAVLPQGVMINFLTRHPNPTPYFGYMPDTITVFGEQRMLAALRRTPPTFVVVLTVDAGEYGARDFGRDYARPTRWWLDENYERVAVVGAPPYESKAYGMALLRHTGGGAAPAGGARSAAEGRQ